MGLKSWSSLIRCLRALALLNAYLGVCWALDAHLLKQWKQQSSSSSDGSGPHLSACSGHLLTFSNTFIPVLSPALEVGFHFSHFTDQKKESQDSEINCPRSQNKSVAKPRYEIRSGLISGPEHFPLWNKASQNAFHTKNKKQTSNKKPQTKASDYQLNHFLLTQEVQSQKPV